jgi:hypothetical protein
MWTLDREPILQNAESSTFVCGECAAAMHLTRTTDPQLFCANLPGFLIRLGL